MKRQSEASILFYKHLKELFPRERHYEVVPEYKFLRDRKFRFDFAVLDRSIAIEIDGGVFSNGRHTRGTGFVRDMEKMNLAAAAGWRVFRFTPQQVLKGEAREFLMEHFSPLYKS